MSSEIIVAILGMAAVILTALITDRRAAKRGDLDRVTLLLNSLQAEVQSLRAENAGLRQDNDDLRDSIADLTKRVSELERENAQLRQENQLLRGLRGKL